MTLVSQALVFFVKQNSLFSASRIPYREQGKFPVFIIQGHHPF